MVKKKSKWYEYVSGRWDYLAVDKRELTFVQPSIIPDNFLRVSFQI